MLTAYIPNIICQVPMVIYCSCQAEC